MKSGKQLGGSVRFAGLLGLGLALGLSFNAMAKSPSQSNTSLQELDRLAQLCMADLVNSMENSSASEVHENCRSYLLATERAAKLKRVQKTLSPDLAQLSAEDDEAKQEMADIAEQLERDTSVLSEGVDRLVDALFRSVKDAH